MNRFSFILSAIALLSLRTLAVEEAKFKIIDKEDDFEIRDYAPQIVAEITIDNTLEEAGNQAFRPLFKYISGENSKSSKISMTAPVSQEVAGQKISMTAPVSQQVSGDGWAVSFMMPQTYTMQSIPKPKNEKIKLREIPARRIAAIRYSGTWSEERYTKNLKLLQEWIKKRGLSAAGDPIWARYNPPFMPWFLRRNEVLIPLKKKPFSPDFFAFQNGLGFGSHSKEAKILRKMGYDGVSQVKQTGRSLARLVEDYEKKGARVLSVYLDAAKAPINAGLIKPLENCNAMVELTIREMTPDTIANVRQITETAAALNIKVALYPHHGFAVATMSQAMDMIKKVNHPNLGVMFNLCHFLKSEDPATLESTLLKAGDRLFAVSTSGAVEGCKDWSCLIMPLNKGSFPQKRLFQALKKIDFNGPVGLQCYGIKGDKRDNLESSIKAWKELIKAL